MNNYRLKLINCTPELLNWILKGNDVLSKNLKVNVPNNWTESGPEIFNYFLKVIIEDPKAQKYLNYLPIDNKTNMLIGSCGFKGTPKNGRVEIGYEVCMDFRNQGFATEMVQLLLEIALASKQINKVVAHTIAKDNASTSVLKKCGFSFVKAILDEVDGIVYRWQL